MAEREDTPQRFHEPSKPETIETALGVARRQFGKRNAAPPSVASFEQAHEAARILDPLSFDWDFARHRFEANWQLVHQQLISMGKSAGRSPRRGGMSV